jgi:hypothetical protein
MWSVVYKMRLLKLTICACYTWDVALNVGLNESFGNKYDSKGIQENVGNLIVRKLIYQMMRFLNECYTDSSRKQST